MRHLWEMLFWGQWDHALYFWDSWCFCDTVAPEVQMRLCWEMLIWGQWVFVLNSWVSWCFFDTVAPDVQMRLCWKCWFEGNESLFLIPESPESFVTLLHLMFKWDLVGNVDLRAMSPLFLIPESPVAPAFVTLLLLMFKYRPYCWDQFAWLLPGLPRFNPGLIFLQVLNKPVQSWLWSNSRFFQALLVSWT